MTPPCFLCGAATPKTLHGDASVGPTRGLYCIAICADCWRLFDDTGANADTIKSEIVRQVISPVLGG